MKRTALLLVLLMVLAFVVVSCKVDPIAIPTGCEKSLLYTKLQYPRTLLSTAAFAAFEIVKNNKKLVAAKQDIITTFDNVDTALATSSGLTVGSVVTLITQQFKGIGSKYGTELIILPTLFADFDPKVPLDKCDIDLIRTDFVQKARLYMGYLP